MPLDQPEVPHAERTAVPARYDPLAMCDGIAPSRSPVCGAPTSTVAQPCAGAASSKSSTPTPALRSVVQPGGSPSVQHSPCAVLGAVVNPQFSAENGRAQHPPSPMREATMPPKDSVSTMCSASSEGNECYTECPAVADAPSDTSRRATSPSSRSAAPAEAGTATGTASRLTRVSRREGRIQLSIGAEPRQRPARLR